MPSSKGLECRLCLGNVYRMHNLIQNPYTTDYVLSIADSIETFFDIKISSEDNYSKLICGNCLTIIHFIHMHRKTFQKAQAFLNPLKSGILKDNGSVLHKVISKIKEEIREDVTKLSVPMEYFRTTNPSVVINSRERYLAESHLEDNTELPEMKFERIDYKKNPPKGTRREDNVKKPFLVRELVQGNILIDRKLDWRKEKEKDESESLLTLWMQSKVFVCYACDKVFEKRCYLKRHISSHA